MNTANKLTLARVVMIPLFLLVLYLHVPGANYWALLIVIVREFAVSGLRMVAADKGRVIAAGWSGKVKTASTMVCICLMLLLPRFVELSAICVAVIVLTTIWSGVEYFMKNLDVLSEVK